MSRLRRRAARSRDPYQGERYRDLDAESLEQQWDGAAVEFWVACYDVSDPKYVYGYDPADPATRAYDVLIELVEHGDDGDVLLFTACWSPTEHPPFYVDDGWHCRPEAQRVAWARLPSACRREVWSWARDAWAG